MLSVAAGARVYLATEPVDLRRGHDGLAALVRTQFGMDPLVGDLFVFLGRRLQPTPFSIPIEHHHDSLPVASTARQAGAARPQGGPGRARSRAHRSDRRDVRSLVEAAQGWCVLSSRLTAGIRGLTAPILAQS